MKKQLVINTCIVIVLGICGALLVQNLFSFAYNTADDADHNESSTFMSYAGPLFPLTLSEADNTISATRNISYDFSLPNEDSIRVWGADVQDSYTLTNSSTEEKAIEAIYPFAGSFNELQEQMPVISINGRKPSPTLYAGGYPERELGTWEDYKSLLEDGHYQREAFESYPVLSQQVTVYSFSDFVAPAEYDAATQAISFTIDPAQTTVLLYGFNGMEIREDGFRRYSYFVPDGKSMRSTTKLLIVIGEDLTAYTLQGYKNGACEKGNELQGVSATVSRTERVLSEVLDEIISDFFAQYGDGKSLAVPQEMFLGAVSEFMVQAGVLSDLNCDRYQYTVIEDIISGTNTRKRVFYYKFEVTIPAGGSVPVTVNMPKKPSHDFAGIRSKNKGVQGYDVVTSLGSNLHFAALTAELTSTEPIEIVRHNYGFNLAQGVTKVELAPPKEYHFLEIRPVE